jgi:hypothetical protein
MKKIIFLVSIAVLVFTGCKKSSSTTYCYRCNGIQYGSQTPLILDTQNICTTTSTQDLFGSGATLAYQKGDSFIYQTGSPSIDTERCYRYNQ